MKVTLLLADYAEAVNGKLYVMGGGWSVTTAEPLGTMALALKVEVPWDEANRRHRLEIRLVDADGHDITQPDPASGQESPIEFVADFEVGRPPGLKPGTPIDSALALNVQRPALAPDSRYAWQLWIDGETKAEWAVTFTTRPAVPGVSV